MTTFLLRQGTPQHPDDLAGHNYLIYTYMPSPYVWEWRVPGGGAVRVAVRDTLRSNNGGLLRAAAVAGAGIVPVPDFMIGDDLRTGRVVPLLCDWRQPASGIHAVHPQNRFVPSKVHAGRLSARALWPAALLAGGNAVAAGLSVLVRGTGRCYIRPAMQTIRLRRR